MIGTISSLFDLLVAVPAPVVLVLVILLPALEASAFVGLVKTSTQLTRESHVLTAELHRRLLGSDAGEERGDQA